ncbi:MAG: SRPBCC domain-containing protein [Bacilli bacterium]
MIEGRLRVDSSLDDVRRMLSDPELLLGRVKRIREFKRLDERTVRLWVNVDTGVGWALYRFDALLEYGVGGRVLTVSAEGCCAQNTIEFKVQLVPSDGNGHTDLHYTIDARARGGLASVAQRTVQQVVARNVLEWLRLVLDLQQQPA